MRRLARLPLLLCACVALVVGAPAVASPVVSQQGAASVEAASVTSSAQLHMNTILVKVNELRASLGLAPVTRYQQLDKIAQDWSDHLAARGGDLYHNPEFGSLYPAGYRSGSENVAMRSDGGDIGALLFEQWRTSPGHYKNMVAPEANSIGIGLAYDSASGAWYSTQNFASYPDPAGAGLTESSPTTPPAQTEPQTEASPAAPQPGSNGSHPGPEGPGKESATKPDTSVPQPTAQPTQVKPDDKATAPATPEGKKSGSNPSAAPTDSNVIALPPTKSPTESATAPVPAVAAPEDVQRSDGDDKSLPVTGVSLAYWALAVGLAGAGVVLLSTRRLSRRRA